jgi:hypothetical protein
MNNGNVRNRKVRNHSSEIIFTMLLFCLFTFAIMAVLISGVSVYKNTEEVMRSRYEERTAIAYVLTRLRQGDTSGAVSVESNEFVDSMVVITEEIYGDYKTYIYSYEGWIYEMFTEAGMKFDPNAGTRIVEAENLKFEILKSDLLFIECTSTGGAVGNVRINLKSAKS